MGLAQQRNSAATPAPRREIARDGADLAAMVTREAGDRVKVRLVDISPLGFHARTIDVQFVRGERIRIILPLIGEVQAHVMWGLKECFGCKFRMSIDRQLYPRLLATIKSGRTSWLSDI